MSNYQDQMQQLVRDFVGQLGELYQRAVVDALGGSLGGGKSGKSASSSASRGKGQKRSEEELDKLADSFVAFVGKNPGLRIEQINKQLGTTTKDLALPIRKLVAEKRIKAKGAKRSTTYAAT